MHYFERKLRFKDLEIWDIVLDERIYRIAIIDEKRAPTLMDLDIPFSAISEELRRNIINVKIYSEETVKEEHIEKLDEFAKQLTDHVALAHCDIVIKFFTGNTDESIKQLLKEKYNIVYDDIPLKKLWHLNQD